MAEGGDSMDNDHPRLCEICVEDGNEINAEYVCLQCEQNLCLECKKYHKKAKVSKSHDVIGIDETPTLSSLTAGSDAIETPTCREHQAVIQFFCKSHMEELCLTCKLMNHKGCQSVTSLDKAVKDFYTDDYCKKIVKSINDLLSWVSCCKDIAGREKVILNEKKQTAIDKIKEIRTDIEVYLDMLEVTLTNDIDSICQEQANILSNQIQIYDTAVSSLHKRLGCLDKAMSIGGAEEKFIESNKANKETNQYCNILSDMWHELNEVDILFDQESLLTNLKEVLPKLGSVSCAKTQRIVTLKGDNAIYNQEIKVRTESDKAVPFVSDYDILPDGKQLIVDSSNRKLKLFDKRSIFVTELGLPDFRLCTVVLQNEREAILTTFSRDILVFDIADQEISLKEIRQAETQVGPIMKYETDLLAITYRSVIYISVIDMQGNIKSQIFKDSRKLFEKPQCIAYKADNKTIYVVDRFNGCFAVTHRGQILFNYRAPMIEEYGGLALGQHCLFVGVVHEKRLKIRKLNLIGDMIEDLSFKATYPVKTMGTKFIMVSKCTTERSVDIYHLLEPLWKFSTFVPYLLWPTLDHISRSHNRKDFW